MGAIGPSSLGGTTSAQPDKTWPQKNVLLTRSSAFLQPAPFTTVFLPTMGRHHPLCDSLLWPHGTPAVDSPLLVQSIVCREPCVGQAFAMYPHVGLGGNGSSFIPAARIDNVFRSSCPCPCIIRLSTCSARQARFARLCHVGPVEALVQHPWPLKTIYFRTTRSRRKSREQAHKVEQYFVLHPIEFCRRP